MRNDPPEWDQEDPTTIGQLVDWFMEAEKHLSEPNMRDYVGGRWVYHITNLSEAQGVPTGWLAYMVQSLVVEAHG